MTSAARTTVPATGFRDLLNGMLEGFQLIGRDWRYLFVNDVVCQHGRRSREELLGRTMMEIYPGIDETPMFAALRRCMEERCPQRLENAFRYPDGATRWFDLSIQPAAEGIFILSTDITDRKRAELQAAQRVEQLQALRAIDQAILGSHDLTLTLNVAVTETLATLGATAARVLLLAPDSTTLVPAVHQGFRDAAAWPQAVPLGSGAAGQCVIERRALFVAHRSATGDGHQSLSPGDDFASCAAAPLIAKGTVTGVLEVYLRDGAEPDDDWLGFLETLAGQTAIAIESASALTELRRAHGELNQAYEATIEGWSRAMDLRDKETEGHTLRVTEMTLELGRMAGFSDEELVHVRRGALLHDIGKLGVPDHILLKAGPLSDDEWVLMRKHPQYAYDMLYPIQYLRPALDIPYCHHERWDGGGYPRGLRGEEIPPAARLFAVVDVWDALRSDRPYRPAWPEDKVREHIRSLSGSHFEPHAVELFTEALRRGIRSLLPVLGTGW